MDPAHFPEKTMDPRAHGTHGSMGPNPTLIFGLDNDVSFSTISMDLEGFDNNFENIEKYAFSKSQNTTF